jgi:hypothetical protein
VVMSTVLGHGEALVLVTAYLRHFGG